MEGRRTPTDLPESNSTTAGLYNFFSHTTSSYYNSSPPNNAEALLAADKAARESLPRVYTIEFDPEDDSPDVNIGFLGDQGSADLTSPHQNQVAKLMNEVAGQYPLRMVLGGGDNFYPDGVSEPDESRFEQQFYIPYANPEYPNLKKVPFGLGIGNHDGGHCKVPKTISSMKAWSPISVPNVWPMKTNPLVGREAELVLIKHGMMADKSDPEGLKNKPEFFKQNTLNHKYLPKFFMPHFFYSLIFGNVQFFIFNSSTLAEDFLKKAEGDPSPFNQATWMECEYDKAIKAGRKTIFLLHHPLEALDKRNYTFGQEAKLYLSSEQIAKLCPMLGLNSESHQSNYSNASYNEILYYIIYLQLKMKPDLLLTSHFHALNYLIKGNICQIGSGSGGDELQDMLAYEKHLQVGSFLKDYGFVMLSFNKLKPTVFNIHIFTVNGKHLQFTNESIEPIRANKKRIKEIEIRTNEIIDPIQPINEKNIEEIYKLTEEIYKLTEESFKLTSIEAIRNIVLSACEKYQQFLAAKQAESKGYFLYTFMKSYTQCDIDVMHEMISFFNKAAIIKEHEVIPFLLEMLPRLSDKTENSLFADIRNNLIKKKYIAETELQLPPPNPIKTYFGYS